MQDGNSSFFSRLSIDQPHIVALALVAATTYVLIEMNNVNMLVRIRTRLVSSTWLVFVATIGALHVYSPGLVSALCMAVACYLLFTTYQKRECETSTFHYSLMIGVASIFVPYCIAFLPIFLWHQLVFLRSMSLRSFCAAFVGCLFPWMLWAGYWVYLDDYTVLIEWVDSLITYYPLDEESYLLLSYQQMASWGFVTLLTLIGAVHYLNTSYNDKIQVRMMLYAFVIQFFAIEIFVGLQPQHLDDMLPVLLVVGAPLIAHFFALTSSWFTNILFILSVLAIGALGYFNLYYWV